MGVRHTDAAVAETPHDGDESDLLARATWTAAFIDTLPDSSFAVVSDGGAKKDSDGITHPLTLRHLPFKDADGKIDLPHLRNALARLPQSSLSAEDKATAEKVLAAAAKEAGVGEEDKSDSGKRAADAPAASELTGTLYAPFVRRDDAKWEVEGVLTSEAIDTYGTSFDYDSAKRAVAEWAGNVREQHDRTKAVGRRVEYDCDDANRLVRLRVRVSKGAPDTWAKVVDGTLSGFSISAVNARRETRSINGKAVPVYKDYSYGEVSLVDVPSNPDAAGSGLVICRAAGLNASGQNEWNDAVLTTFDTSDTHGAAPVETPAAPEAAPEERAAAHATEPVAETPVEAPAVSPVETPAAMAAGEIPAGMPSLESLVGPLSTEQRAAIAAAVSVITGGAGQPTATPAVSTPVAEASAAPAETLTRAGIDLASGAAFQGNDLASNGGDGNHADDGMLGDSGHAHGAHTHGHATSYGDMHTHDHTHTHQDGTAHSHPHMHNHQHHEHYGDAGHSHAHSHTHDHSHEYRKAAPDMSTWTEPYPDGREVATGIAPAGAPAIIPAIAPTGSPVDTALDTRAAGTHDPFTGTHEHAHPAFGSQGGDESHTHEHSHDGDADHGHSHESGDGERAATGESDLERAAKAASAKGAKPKVSPADQKVNAAIAEVAAALDALKAAQASDEASEGKTVSPGDKSVDTAIANAFAALEKIRTAQEADIASDSDDDGEDGKRAAAGGDLTAVLTPDVSSGASPETPETAPETPATLTRAGQRISAATSSALHQSALGILLVCGCPTCQDAASLLNPDDEDDGEGDAGDDSDDGARAQRGQLTRAMRMQRVALTRATRKAVATEVQTQLAPMSGLIQQMRGIAARLTSVPSVPTVNPVNGSSESQPDGGNASVKSQLDEFRASVETQMRAVQGLVEQIAAQPASGGPILRAVDKTLGMYDPAHALDASQAPASPGDLSPEHLTAAIRQLQRSGVLSDQGSQVSAAAALLQQQMNGRR